MKRQLANYTQVLGRRYSHTVQGKEGLGPCHPTENEGEISDKVLTAPASGTRSRSPSLCLKHCPHVTLSLGPLGMDLDPLPLFVSLFSATSKFHDKRDHPFLKFLQGKHPEFKGKLINLDQETRLLEHLWVFKILLKNKRLKCLYLTDFLISFQPKFPSGHIKTLPSELRGAKVTLRPLNFCGKHKIPWEFLVGVQPQGCPQCHDEHTC